MTDLSIGARGHDLERDVEAELGKRLKALGCLFWKFVSPGTSGVPDRIVLTPTGAVYFVELKAAGGRRDEIQVYRAEQIVAHGGAAAEDAGEHEQHQRGKPARARGKPVEHAVIAAH